MKVFSQNLVVRRQALGVMLALGAGLAHAQATAPLEVPVVAVGRQAVSLGFEFDGVVEPVRQSTVSAQASGRVASITVKAGDPVRAGQLLATIDDRETQTVVERSRAQVAQADAELRNAQVNLERTRDLRADVIVTGLPVKTEPVADALLDVVQPQFIVVADAEFPATERAGGQLRDRLELRKIPVLYTRRAGAVEFVFGAGGWKVTAADGSFYEFPVPAAH